MTTVTLIAASLVAFVGPASAAANDGGADFLTGTDSQTVVISGTQTQTSSDGPRDSAPRPDSPSSPAFPVHEFDFDSCLDDWNSSRGCFRTVIDEEPSSPGTDSPAAPAITIDDLAQFAPDPVANEGEPDNVGVAGMPTNFIAAASVHTRSGTLFGAPLSVRFTPVGYEFVHGDGTSATSSTGGQTWSALGQSPFTPTSTSHVYSERGTYQAHVTVRYAAEVDLGGGWFPVAGDLTIPGPAREIRIFEAHTALVAFTCAQRPSAPGC
ncbi:hypothetical protein [Microbacterium maritypicum]|uniref:hypothetical protein n=1 Tax=Microbacterium maritypicum TaxID=33918 RepID=UPI003CEDB0A8